MELQHRCLANIIPTLALPHSSTGNQVTIQPHRLSMGSFRDKTMPLQNRHGGGLEP